MVAEGPGVPQLLSPGSQEAEGGEELGTSYILPGHTLVTTSSQAPSSNSTFSPGLIPGGIRW